MSTWLPEPELDPERVRELARQVLDQAAYRRPAPGLLQRLRERVLELLADAIGQLLQGGASSWIGWIIVGVSVAALTALVAAYARRVTTDPRLATNEPTRLARRPADWDAEAAAHERAGRWRDAIRCRYRGLLAALTERGLVEEVPGRTAGEYRRHLTIAVPDVASEVTTITDLFQRTWYGDDPGSSTDAEELQRLADRVLEVTG